MPKKLSPDSDSTSEDDDLEKLRESVDQQFLNDALYLDDPNKNSIAQKELPKLPSLRRNIHEEDEALNFFRVTPEFQGYVARHLSAKLEEELKQSEVAIASAKGGGNPTYKRKKHKSGIKLLHASQHKLKVFKFADADIEPMCRKTAQKVDDVDEDALAAKCEQVAVEGVDVLQGKDVKFWSTRSKAEVFRYKQVQPGVLQYQEPRFASVTYK